MGTDAYRKAALEDTIRSTSIPLPALNRIHTQAAFALSALCFNARPVYLSRVSEPHLYWKAMQTFDTRVDEAIADLARTPLTPVITAIRSLPQRMGGLGLSPMAGARSEEGCLAARKNTKEFIERYFPRQLESREWVIGCG